jgi:hypothetical protein
MFLTISQSLPKNLMLDPGYFVNNITFKIGGGGKNIIFLRDKVVW